VRLQVDNHALPCRAAKGSINKEGLMARTFVALGLFLATSIGFAGPAPAQYNPIPNPSTTAREPTKGYQGNQGYQGGQQDAGSIPATPK
jgi:hypothetical protein